MPKLNRFSGRHQFIRIAGYPSATVKELASALLTGKVSLAGTFLAVR